MGRKELNPADVYRKEQRKKDLKKCKENRTVVRAVRELLSDPNKIEEEIQKAQKESDGSQLDRSLKDRVKELKMMKSVAVTKQKIDIASGKADREAAAKLRETELLLRTNRRTFKPDDYPSANQKNDPDPLLISQGSQDTTQQKRQSVYEAPIDIQIVPLNMKMSQPIGIAPMLGITSILPPTFIVPPPPPPPPLMRFPASNLPKTFPLVTSLQLPTNIAHQTANILIPLPPMPPPLYLSKSTDTTPNVLSDGVDIKMTSVFNSADIPTVKNSTTSRSDATEFQMKSAPFTFSTSDFVMPSAADLMKRRHQLSDERETVTVQYEDSLENGVESSYPQPYKLHPVDETDQLPSETPLTHHHNSEGTDGLSCDSTQPIDISRRGGNKHISPPSVILSGGLGGLADYGSDDDDDDADAIADSSTSHLSENVIGKKFHGSSSSEVPKFTPRSFPSALLNYSEVVQPAGSDALASMTAMELNSFAPLPCRAGYSSAANEWEPIRNKDTDKIALFKDVENKTESGLVGQTDAVVLTALSTQNSQEPHRKPGLKSMRPDSALTAFLPAALRMKRTIINGGRDSVAKVPRSHDGKSCFEGTSSTNLMVSVTDQKASGLQGKGGAVEDAYLNFLDEIDELTGNS